MKTCANCKAPAKCLLCADCWRASIISPIVVFTVGWLLHKLIP